MNSLHLSHPPKYRICVTEQIHHVQLHSKKKYTRDIHRRLRYTPHRPFIDYRMTEKTNPSVGSFLKIERVGRAGIQSGRWKVNLRAWPAALHSVAGSIQISHCDSCPAVVGKTDCCIGPGALTPHNHRSLHPTIQFTGIINIRTAVRGRISASVLRFMLMGRR